MEKINREGVENKNVQEHKGAHHDSTEWMDQIAETMSKVKSDPSLSYEEKRKMLDDYRKAMSSIN